jgi:superfamily II DNA or RNA helicase
MSSDNTSPALQRRRGDYDVSELESLYTADDARVRVVLRQLRDKVGDTSRMRALGFCVSVGHARFMADRFTAAGIPALAVSGDSPRAEREHALRALRTGDVRALFAVDLFNEGLDVPDVDTLLLLRPTQSATVFLQQLGRGLRRTPTKPVLTVLDLVGQQNRNFRFDLRYRALTGTGRASLIRQLEKGFSYLPSGCEVVLDPVAQRTILDNVKRQLTLTRAQLATEVRSYGDLDLQS